MEKAPASIKSVAKALALLDLIALDDLSRRGVPLSELAESLGLPVNTAHNLLKTLISSGYVTQSARGIYRAGPKCDQIARLGLVGDESFRARLLARLQSFVDDTGEACTFTTLAHGQRVVVAVVDSNHAVRVSRAGIEGAPFFSRVTARTLAAFAGPGELGQILEKHGMPGPEWPGINSMGTLQAALADLKRQGFCINEDSGSDLVAIACPLPDGRGGVWGALGTYAPAYRCPPERREELKDRLLKLASSVAELFA